MPSPHSNHFVTAGNRDQAYFLSGHLFHQIPPREKNGFQTLSFKARPYMSLALIDVKPALNEHPRPLFASPFLFSKNRRVVIFLTKSRIVNYRSTETFWEFIFECLYDLMCNLSDTCQMRPFFINSNTVPH